MSDNGFCWTARFFQNGKPTKSKYFATREERDDFVAANNGWKKRGKICVENLEKHEQEKINLCKQ